MWDLDSWLCCGEREKRRRRNCEDWKLAAARERVMAERVGRTGHRDITASDSVVRRDKGLGSFLLSGLGLFFSGFHFPIFSSYLDLQVRWFRILRIGFGVYGEGMGFG